MADATDEPTQQQTDAANAARDAEIAKWEGDFPEEQLDVPYKREAEGKTEEDKVDEPDKSKDTEEEVASVEQITQPEPIITMPDPGEFKPADYSFEVTLADGKTHKVSTPEEAENLADDSDNFETPKQLMDFLSKSNKMQRNIERDQEKWQEKKDKFDEQVALDTERQQTVENLTKGFEYLISKGLMPPIDPADAVADWSDPEVAKYEGVAEQISLINYMTKENETREKAGIPLLTSALDAYNAWQLDSGRKSEQQKRQEQADEEKRQADARKAAGARVAGTSPAPQAPYIPKGISVGNPNILRRGASVWDD